MITVTEVTAPANYVRSTNDSVFFLAGSIEMGTAEDWQSTLISAVKNAADKTNVTLASLNSSYPQAVLHNVALINPRRPDWDASWKQSIHNPQFYQQVSWELTNLDAADHIFMYLAPNTISPISLLELGLYAPSKKLTVAVHPDFQRIGNVQIVCQKFSIPILNSLQDLIQEVVWRL